MVVDFVPDELLVAESFSRREVDVVEELLNEELKTRVE